MGACCSSRGDLTCLGSLLFAVQKHDSAACCCCQGRMVACGYLQVAQGRQAPAREQA